MSGAPLLLCAFACSTLLAACSEGPGERAGARLRRRRRADPPGALRRVPRRRRPRGPRWSATSFLGAIACVAPSGAPATLPRRRPRAGARRAGDAPPRGPSRRCRARDPRSVGGKRHARLPGRRPRPEHHRPAPGRLPRRGPGGVAVVADARSRRPRRVRSLPRRHALAPRGRDERGTRRAVVHELPRPAGRRARVPDLPRLGDERFTAARSVLLPRRCGRGARGPRRRPLRRRRGGVPCSTCHPVPGVPVIGGLHGDGVVQVAFDPAQVPGAPTYDGASGACAVYCHVPGGHLDGGHLDGACVPRLVPGLSPVAAGGPTPPGPATAAARGRPTPRARR